MGNTEFKFESRIYYFIDLQNEEDYEGKNQVVLGEGLSEELICQFKTETDVSIFYQKSYPNNK